jgi:SAM-dependent methyltransferase
MTGRDQPRLDATHWRRVSAYYESTQVLYSTLWSRSGIHYGLWEGDTRSHGESIDNLDRSVAVRLGLQPGGRVLDAGCGVGGTSCHLAAVHALRVVGITVSPTQARWARQRAMRLPAPRRPTFLLADYTRSAFADASFDGIVAIESSCHAERKTDFLAEAFRLLRAGGRLVVADGFRADGVALANDERYRILCAGMALPGLAAAGEFRDVVRCGGFALEEDIDLTAAILPSAHRIATLSRIGVRVCSALQLPSAWLAHGLAGLAQLPLFRERALTYRLVVARKPAR